MNCLRCKKETNKVIRGLCTKCYNWAYYHDCLEDYPSKYWKKETLVEEYLFLKRTEGLTRAQAAKRLGISKGRLEQAITRTRKGL